MLRFRCSCLLLSLVLLACGDGIGDVEGLDLPADPDVGRFPVDFEHISYVTPIGSISGGGEIKNRHLVFANDAFDDIPVYAPADGYVVRANHLTRTSADDAYFQVDIQIAEAVTVTLTHIWRPSPEIAAILPPVRTGFLPPMEIEPFAVRAGDRIGSIQTALEGVNSYGMDLVTIDARHTNTFANQARYEGRDYQAFRAAVCFEDILDDPMARAELGRLYGIDAVIPGVGCGTMERDVPGTLAGMWFLDAEPDPTYGVRLAIGLEAHGSVRLNVDLQQPLEMWFIAEGAPDPATVVAGMEQCYVDGRPESPTRFAFFRLTDAVTMDVAFGEGACPSAFPAQFRVYHR